MPISPPMAEEAFYQERGKIDPAWDQYTDITLESPYKEQAFMKDLNTDSASEFEASANTYQYFKQEVIGAYDEPLLLLTRDPTPPSKAMAGWVMKWCWMYPDGHYGVLYVPKKCSREKNAR